MGEKIDKASSSRRSEAEETLLQHGGEPVSNKAKAAFDGDQDGAGEKDEDRGPAAHLFLWLTALLVAGFGFWAYIGPLDIVSTATGEVIPSTKLKSIQHLEGGIVQDILVNEGDMVQPGQELVILEETATGSTVEELSVRISALTVEAIRLEAEAKGEESLTFPADLIASAPEVVERAQKLFQSRQTRLKGDLTAKRQIIRQREQDVREISARLKNTRESLRLVREVVAVCEELLKDELTTKYKHLSFLREESGLVSKLEEDTAALPRSRSALAEARADYTNIQNAFRETARKELNEKRRELEELGQRMIKFSDTLQRTVIRSPVGGVIKTLYIVTRGGVVQPGQIILDIVPVEDRLVVEAHLPISDIGYVQVGQTAVVKLASRDAGRYGKIDGEVAQVSPDTFTGEDGATYYSVRIVTVEDSFKRGDFEYKLVPGMLVSAYIHTGKRTVLEYLADPFLDSMSKAMQER